MSILNFVWLFSIIILVSYVPFINAATPFFAENRFTEIGIEWCEEERQRYEVLGDFWFEHHNYSIEARICANLYQDPLWDYNGPDRIQKLIERSGYFVELEILESEEEAKTGIDDPTPVEVPEETTVETMLDEKQGEDIEQENVQQPQRSPDSVGGCLIATATFDSEWSTQVQQLREIREDVVLATESGSVFLSTFNDFYYVFSPTIADLERQSLLFKETVKITITPLLTTLSILNYVEIDSEAEMMLYGTIIISLNLGMYVAAPLLLVSKLKRKFF